MLAAASVSIALNRASILCIGPHPRPPGHGFEEQGRKVEGTGVFCLRRIIFSILRLCFGLARACVPHASEVWDWLREHSSFSLDAIERVGSHRSESRFQFAAVAYCACHASCIFRPYLWVSCVSASSSQSCVVVPLFLPRRI